MTYRATAHVHASNLRPFCGLSPLGVSEAFKTPRRIMIAGLATACGTCGLWPPAHSTPVHSRALQLSHSAHRRSERSLIAASSFIRTRASGAPSAPQTAPSRFAKGALTACMAPYKFQRHRLFRNLASTHQVQMYRSVMETPDYCLVCRQVDCGGMMHSWTTGRTTMRAATQMPCRSLVHSISRPALSTSRIVPRAARASTPQSRPHLRPGTSSGSSLLLHQGARSMAPAWLSPQLTPIATAGDTIGSSRGLCRRIQSALRQMAPAPARR